MNIRYLLFSTALVLSAQPSLAVADDGGSTWGAGGSAQISDVWEFLREVDRTILMAEEGQYGKVSDEDLYRVVEAGRTIKGLLAGRGSADRLDGAQKQALMNARELIGTVLRSADKDREVCLPAMITGSRLPREECMTVQEREERAYIQRERRWPPTYR